MGRDGHQDGGPPLRHRDEHWISPASAAAVDVPRLLPPPTSEQRRTRRIHVFGASAVARRDESAQRGGDRRGALADAAKVERCVACCRRHYIAPGATKGPTAPTTKAPCSSPPRCAAQLSPPPGTRRRGAVQWWDPLDRRPRGAGAGDRRGVQPCRPRDARGRRAALRRRESLGPGCPSQSPARTTRQSSTRRATGIANYEMVKGARPLGTAISRPTGVPLFPFGHGLSYSSFALACAREGTTGSAFECTVTHRRPRRRPRGARLLHVGPRRRRAPDGRARANKTVDERHIRRTREVASSGSAAKEGAWGEGDLSFGGRRPRADGGGRQPPPCTRAATSSPSWATARRWWHVGCRWHRSRRDLIRGREAPTSHAGRGVRGGSASTTCAESSPRTKGWPTRPNVNLVATAANPNGEDPRRRPRLQLRRHLRRRLRGSQQRGDDAFPVRHSTLERRRHERRGGRRRRCRSTSAASRRAHRVVLDVADRVLARRHLVERGERLVRRLHHRAKRRHDLEEPREGDPPRDERRARLTASPALAKATALDRTAPVGAVEGDRRGVVRRSERRHARCIVLAELGWRR